MSANRQQREWQRRNLKKRFGRSNSIEDLRPHRSADGSQESLKHPEPEPKSLKFQPKRTPPPATPNFAPNDEVLEHYGTSQRPPEYQPRH